MGALLLSNRFAVLILSADSRWAAAFSGKKNAPLQAVGRLNKPTFIRWSPKALALKDRTSYLCTLHVKF